MSNKTPEKLKIFVYGTLKFQERLGKRINTKAQIRGDMFDLGPFPAAINVGKSDNLIEGHIVEIYSYQLSILDIYEQVPNGLYERVTVKTVDGTEVQTYQFAQKIGDKDLPIIKRWPTEKGLVAWKAQ